MSRPSGKILLSKQVKRIFWEIKEGQGLWVLAYKKCPVKVVRTTDRPSCNNYHDHSVPTAWMNKAHGENRVDKLNKMFKTDDFSLLELWAEETAKPSASDTRSDRPGLLNRWREGE